MHSIIHLSSSPKMLIDFAVSSGMVFSDWLGLDHVSRCKERGSEMGISNPPEPHGLSGIIIERGWSGFPRHAEQAKPKQANVCALLLDGM